MGTMKNDAAEMDWVEEERKKEREIVMTFSQQCPFFMFTTLCDKHQ